MTDDRDRKERLTQLLLNHLGKYYQPPCNYLLVQVEKLLKLCAEKYSGDLETFENDCIRVMTTVLGNLSANKLPITYENKGQIFVVIHLTEPDIKMEAGEVVIWVGKSDPSSLSMKYVRYVTERDGVPIPDPFYEATKMRIKKEDVNRCLTSSYYRELRQGFKAKGAERYSLAMRLFVAYNTTTMDMHSLDHDKILVSRRPRTTRNPKLCDHRTRSESGVQETGDDPATSTEQQDLRNALKEYHDYRASGKRRPNNDQDYRSSSPTGTEASTYNPPAEETRPTDDMSSSDDEHADLYNASDDEQVGESRSEPEPIATVKRIPRDGYVDEDIAVGPETDQRSQLVEKSVAKTGSDLYV